MHGVVMSGLQSFIEDQRSGPSWREVRKRADIDRTTYSRTDDYPDEEFEQVYEVLVEQFGMDGPTLQQQFGQYLFSSLADIYGRLYFEDEWDALDLIENVEESIHQSLKRRGDATFTPPELETDRIGDHRVVVIYTSDRQLCDLAKGMVQGVADHFDTPLEIDEASCMKDGDERCRLVVTSPAESESRWSEPKSEATQ